MKENELTMPLIKPSLISIIFLFVCFTGTAYLAASGVYNGVFPTMVYIMSTIFTGALFTISLDKRLCYEIKDNQ